MSDTTMRMLNFVKRGMLPSFLKSPETDKLSFLHQLLKDLLVFQPDSDSDESRAGQLYNLYPRKFKTGKYDFSWMVFLTDDQVKQLASKWISSLLLDSQQLGQSQQPLQSKWLQNQQTGEWEDVSNNRFGDLRLATLMSFDRGSQLIVSGKVSKDVWKLLDKLKQEYKSLAGDNEGHWYDSIAKSCSDVKDKVVKVSQEKINDFKGKVEQAPFYDDAMQAKAMKDVSDAVVKFQLKHGILDGANELVLFSQFVSLVSNTKKITEELLKSHPLNPLNLNPKELVTRVKVLCKSGTEVICSLGVLTYSGVAYARQRDINSIDVSKGNVIRNTLNQGKDFVSDKIKVKVGFGELSSFKSTVSNLGEGDKFAKKRAESTKKMLDDFVTSSATLEQHGASSLKEKFDGLMQNIEQFLVRKRNYLSALLNNRADPELDDSLGKRITDKAFTILVSTLRLLIDGLYKLVQFAKEVFKKIAQLISKVRDKLVKISTQLKEEFVSIQQTAQSLVNAIDGVSKVTLKRHLSLMSEIKSFDRSLLKSPS